MESIGAVYDDAVFPNSRHIIPGGVQETRWDVTQVTITAKGET
jgi:hypothetical protein